MPPAPRGLVVAAMRAATPRAIAILARRIDSFEDAEDAVQEALTAAARQWPRDGIPDDPTAWLVTAAHRRAVDAIRSATARRARERRAVEREPPAPAVIEQDDTLALYLMCCHPALPRASQVALTLRAVGGLTTREIARGLIVTEPTVAQRITRAKTTLRRSGATFALPTHEQLAARVGVVLDVLGLIHTESHSATEGDEIARPGLAAEALRLARQLLAASAPESPWRGEVMGLVALILLTDARAPARLDATRALVPLAAQDRTLWTSAMIAEGDRLLTEALARYPIGPFQLRAAIAGVHDSAPSYEQTEWRELLGLYDLLRVVDPGPIVELARLIPLAEVVGAESSLRELDAISASAPPGRVAAVRAHLSQRAGHDARPEYRSAAAHARNGAERRWFEQMAAR